MAPAIPDRWLDYKPIGQRIEGTRFIAFKVPLRQQISNSVEERDARLDGPMLLKSIPNLGIVIDLTNTNRYYDPFKLEVRGVEHKKLMIPGHQTPSNNLVNKFKKYVKDFLNKNKDNDKLIGVHCTHGVNRTGYLICRYMISEMKMKPDEAIKKFNVARGHNIERANYISSLQELLSTEDHGKSKEANTKTNTQLPQNVDSISIRVKPRREYRERSPNLIGDRRDRFQRCHQDIKNNYSNYNDRFHYSRNNTHRMPVNNRVSSYNHMWPELNNARSSKASYTYTDHGFHYGRNQTYYRKKDL